MNDWFDTKRFLISLLIGGIAGGLAAAYFSGQELNSTIIFGLIAAGYAGTDFIEGFMKTEQSSISTKKPDT
jgi:uncharacterized membrane protein YeaQ/YmgE (transglycosylase-associated protein family)